MRLWSSRNIEKKRASDRKYYHGKGKNLRSLHREVINKRQRRWRSENPDKKMAYLRKWRKKNPDKVTAQQKRKCAKNPEKYRILANFRSARHRVRLQKAVGSHTLKQWLAKIELYGWRCFYCKRKLSLKNVSKDHAIPISRNGSDFISNILPSCGFCNSKKGNKTVSEFLQGRAA